MNEEELTPHLEELKKALKEVKVDDSVLLEELDTYINKYHLDADAAMRGILRKHGGSNIGFVTAENVSKKIGDLNGTEQNVDITAKVLFNEKKQISAKGVQKTIVSGLLGDDTGNASFTIWEDVDELVKGSVYRFKNCYTKKWNDRVQINVGNKGVVEKADDVKIDVPESNFSSSS